MRQGDKITGGLDGTGNATAPSPRRIDTMKPGYVLTTFALAAAIAGNRDGDDDGSAAGEAGDSVQVTNDEAQVMELSLQGGDGAAPGKLPALPTAEQVAIRAATRIHAALQPPTCH